MGIDDRHRDDRAAANPGARPPCLGQAATRSPDTVRHRQPFGEAGHDPLRIAFSLGILGLVGGKTQTAHFTAGQLPDQPVAGFDEPSGRTPDVRRLAGDLSGLWQQPFPGQLAAEIAQERPAPAVDGVRIGLRGAVFPQFDIGMRLAGIKFGKGGAVAGGRHRRTGREAEPDRLDDPTTAQHIKDFFRRLQIVGGILQRPRPRQKRAVRQALHHDAMAISMCVTGDLRAGHGVEQDATGGSGAIVQSDDVSRDHPACCLPNASDAARRCFSSALSTAFSTASTVIWKCS